MAAGGGGRRGSVPRWRGLLATRARDNVRGRW